MPALMSFAATLMASLLLNIDRRGWIPDEHSGWLYTGGADGAKTLLSTIAGSVITVAGVAYSITIAALSQASSQFGRRLLHPQALMIYAQALRSLDQQDDMADVIGRWKDMQHAESSGQIAPLEGQAILNGE